MRGALRRCAMRAARCQARRLMRRAPCRRRASASAAATQREQRAQRRHDAALSRECAADAPMRGSRALSRRLFTPRCFGDAPRATLSPEDYAAAPLKRRHFRC